MAADDYEHIIGPLEERMMQTVWRIVGHPDDAEDALQNACLAVWRHFRKVQRHANPPALVLRMCANAAYDALRRRHARSRQSELLDDPVDAACSGEDKLMQVERRAAVRQAIAQLSRKQAVAVMLRDIGDEPYEDVAQALGCRESTARKHVARARERLRALLSHVRGDTTRQGETR